MLCAYAISQTLPLLSKTDSCNASRMRIQTQNGETLIEVMVSLLLFCVAILGLIGSQQRMLVQMFHTESTLTANRLANSLIEQLSVLPASAIAQLDSGINTTPALTCPADSCNSARINTRISLWQQQLEDELPGSEFQFCLDSTPADGSPEVPACAGGGRLAVKIWPQGHSFPAVAALDL